MIEARILQGIHFRTADVVGRKQGRSVAKWSSSTICDPSAMTTKARAMTRTTTDIGIEHWTARRRREAAAGLLFGFPIDGRPDS